MANQLPPEKRVKILHLLLESMSMRGICRVEEVNYRTVAKLLQDASRVGRNYHRQKIKNYPVDDIQCDELWSFCYAKDKRIKKKGKENLPDHAGSAWTWIAMEADTKMVLHYRVDERTDKACNRFMRGLERRIDYDEDLTIFTVGLASYAKATPRYFDEDINHGQIIKSFQGDEPSVAHRQVSGKHVIEKVSTSFVERFNLTVRTHIRRYVRHTSGHSKSPENHQAMLDLFVLWYNFIRVHETLATTPAVAARIVSEPRSLEWLVGKIERQQARDRERVRLEVR